MAMCGGTSGLKPATEAEQKICDEVCLNRFVWRLGHPHKMFRFPSLSLSLKWVGRSGKKKEKNERMIAY